MKKYILNVLKNGFTRSKKPIEEYTKYLYLLKYILIIDDYGCVRCNNNAFWTPENNKKRIELIRDVFNIQKKSIRDNSYFCIINRFENGDKYGIEL